MVLDMPKLEKVIAASVQAERARLGWRQVDLAERLDWSLSQVSDLERNQRAIHVNDLPLLCSALNVSITDLVKHADPEDLRALMLASERRESQT
jgi:transcriptional regulator with XRE-family HTH domain